MSGFDLSELMPYYLDETDEQIAGLNDALLKLEQDATDAAVLREAFRLIHSIKGASTVMGFGQVKDLTHNLETFFDRLRSGERTLDGPTLNLCFRCLDRLRDFHRELRSGNPPQVELASLTTEVISALSGEAPPPVPPPVVVVALPEPAPEPEPKPVEQAEATVAADLPTEPESPSPDWLETVVPEGMVGVIRLTAVFAPNLPWPDMKAKLVMNRLASKARILATEPPSDQLETIEKLPEFRLWLSADCDASELRALADVEGVAEIQIEMEELPSDQGTPQAEPTEAPSTAAPPPPPPAAEREAPEAIPPSAPPPVRVESLAPEPFPVAAKEKEKEPAAPPVAKKVAETLRVDVDRLDSLMNLAGELVINRARFYEIAQGLEDLFRDSNARLLTADTQDRLDSLCHELESFGGSPEAGERWIAQVRRLRDNFTEIRQELDLIRLGRERVNALSEAIHQLDRVTNGLQKGVLDTRMVPIGPLFDRFQRVVRDLRVTSGKEVALKIEGEKTELDKRMIDELGDPLIHMVRNSVDHGLETPDAREKVGKRREGTVSLQASHRGNSVVITVTDDGRGIDCERVRRKIVEKGLVAEEDARRMTERQLVQFIWHPGLSTADKVTDISGRGVGMDIVKSRIENLNGTVDVRTEPGRGTTFIIRLPLTLAILPCLLVRIDEEVYAIPLDHIDEIVEVSEGDVFEVRGRRMIEIRNRLISLVELQDVLDWSVGTRGGAHQPELSGEGPNGGKRTVVVAQNGGTTIALVVHQLIGMQEVVLKSLEKNFRAVDSLSGASILGDGRVSLILDVDALINMVARESATQVV